MKKTLSLAVAIAAIIALAAACSTNEKVKDATPVQLSEDSLIKRGAYLVSFSGCNDCHTPLKMGPKGPEPDMDNMLAGHPAEFPMPKIDTNVTKSWVLFAPTGTAMVGPWGVSFAANITGDETGIGSWTEKQFFKAIREGKYKGLDNSRPMLPPMPWQGYARMSDEDLRAVFLYLKSVKPVKNIVPAAIPPSEIAKK